MTSAAGVLSTVFILLPGFLILRIQQSTKEYREKAVFESTVVSVGYSLLMILLWAGCNAMAGVLTNGSYSSSQELVALSKASDLSRFFSPYTLSFVSIYFACFLAVGLTVYDFQYMDVWFRLLHRAGATRFSQHLTPWEDFLILNRLNWITVELKDGRTLVGKVGLFSQLPFERQIVLTRSADSPIAIYGSDHKQIDFGPPISQTYIPYDEIRTMHAVEDEAIKPILPTVGNYLLTLSSLFVSAGMVLCASIAVAATLTHSWACSAMIGAAFLAGAIITFVVNFLSLRSH